MGWAPRGAEGWLSLGSSTVGRKELVGVEVADHLLRHLGQDALGQRFLGSLWTREHGNSATTETPGPWWGVRRDGPRLVTALGTAGDHNKPSNALLPSQQVSRSFLR